MAIDKIINFLLMFDSIDYSFFGDGDIKWTIDTDGGKKDGSDALLYALLKYVKGMDKVDFSNVSFNEFSSILKGNVDIPFLKERYDTVISISHVVNEKMNGNFYEYIKNIPYLLIDDIGAENVTAWGRDEILGTLLQHRMNENLTTFFTSNLTIEELESHLAVSQNKTEKEKPDENFYKILNDLRGVAVNINQLAKVANTYQYVDDNKYYPLANRVNDMIDDLQKFYLTPTKKNRRIYGSN